MGLFRAGFLVGGDVDERDDEDRVGDVDLLTGIGIGIGGRTKVTGLTAVGDCEPLDEAWSRETLRPTEYDSRYDSEPGEFIGWATSTKLPPNEARVCCSKSEFEESEKVR